MPSGLILAVVLIWAASSAHTAAQPCKRSAVQQAGLQVNCSSLKLMEVPPLPADTTELQLQDNRLSSVSPGSFDQLVHLKKASLSGNPFHCDCRIQYLRNWLLLNKDLISEQPTCASPSSVAHKVISELSDEFFSSCAPAGCIDGAFNALIGVMLCCIILLLLWSLRLAKASTFTLYIDHRHSGLEATSIRSQRPKHRRRMHTDSDTFAMDVEKPPLNMELLPQVLDVLHKKHNIKIKAS